jgi:hypothetical protein
MSEPDQHTTLLRDLTDAELTEALTTAEINVSYSVNDYLTELMRRDTEKAAGQTEKAAARTQWTAVASTVAAVFSAAAAVVTLVVGLTSKTPIGICTPPPRPLPGIDPWLLPGVTGGMGGAPGPGGMGGAPGPGGIGATPPSTPPGPIGPGGLLPGAGGIFQGGPGAVPPSASPTPSGGR